MKFFPVDYKGVLRIVGNNWLPATILTVLAVVVTVGYVRSENTFYWSDYNYYYVGTRFILEEINKGSNPITLLWVSTGLAHNLLFTAPLVLVESVLGSSRLTYITSLIVLYFLPFVLAISAVGTRLCKSGKASAFWMTAAITISLPVVWAPALRGLPDHVSALMMALAIYIYLGENSLSNKRSIVAMGLLLAAAAMLRRHYLYELVSFFLAASIHQLILAKGQSQSFDLKMIRTYCLTRLAPLVVTGCVSLIAFCTFGVLFLNELLVHNWSRLYISLTVPPYAVADYFALSYGFGIWLLAIAGIVAGAKTHAVKGSSLIFIVTFGLLSALIWIAIPRLLAVHFPLHCSILVVGGISSLALVIRDKLGGTQRVLALSSLCGALVLNLIVGLLPTSVLEKVGFNETRFGMINVREKDGGALSHILSVSYPPRVNRNRDLVLALARGLYAEAPADASIYVASAGEALNADILRNAEIELFGKDQHLKLPEPSVTNSMHSYPIEALLHSDYVVTVDPLSNYIDPEKEQVVQVVLDCFNKNWELAKDFQCVAVYTLGDGFRAKVYKRIRPTTMPVAVRALTEMKSLLTVHPGGQPFWITTGAPSNCLSPEQKSYTFDLKAGKPEYLLSAEMIKPSGPDSPFSGDAWGAIKPYRPNLKTSFSLVNPDGKAGAERTFDVAPNGKFALMTDDLSPAYRLIKIESSEPQKIEVEFVQPNH